MSQCPLDNGEDSSLRQIVSNEERAEETPDILRLPKNRSTGDLLAVGKKIQGDGKPRVSFDAGVGHDHGLRSPITAEHEHGLGVSGLRRIRQQPLSIMPTIPSSPSQSQSLPPRSSSMTLGLSSRGFTPTGPASPTINFSEDLSRFPSESLHSFSFAHQSKDALHNRQSVLKRAIDFMRDRLGFGVNHPGIVAAQAKVSGDTEIQSMVDLLVRANVIGREGRDVEQSRQLHGPLTGPPDIEGNVFEKSFLPHSEYPFPTQDRPSSNRSAQNRSGDDLSRSGPAQSEPTLNSGAPVSKLPEPDVPTSGIHTARTAPPSPDQARLKRTYTDLSLLTLQTKLVEAMAKPYQASNHIHDSLILSPTPMTAIGATTGLSTPAHVHGHNNRWVPAAQAVFTTEAASPWTILAANDMACLVFGVTKAELKKLSMLEVVRDDRRAWLEEKLTSEGSEALAKARQPRSKSARSSPKRASSALTKGGGVTAQLLSKPSWRLQRAKTDDLNKKPTKGTPRHPTNKSRGVLLCGDIVPTKKRNGARGAASLWVKEKRGGLIWVLEEIAEDLAMLSLDAKLSLTGATGAAEKLWGRFGVFNGAIIQDLIPKFPQHRDLLMLTNSFKDKTVQYYTAKAADGANIPISVTMEPDSETLRVSSFPHIAGIIVLSASSLTIQSSNSVFCTALFGQADLIGQKITQLVPQFQDALEALTQEDDVQLAHGLVLPEQCFKRARALLALRHSKEDAAALFLKPSGLLARHRDGSEINIDIQMRVVRSEKTAMNDSVIEEQSEGSDDASDNGSVERSEMVYALWITYSRQIPCSTLPPGEATPHISRPGTPHLPSPGQVGGSATPRAVEQQDMEPESLSMVSLSDQIKEAASEPISESPPKHSNPDLTTANPKKVPKKKKRITDFVILEDMGQGAYGQVKLARYLEPPAQKVVLKYVIKRRILVDTWTRDRRLGTVPLEIHVLDYLRKDGLRHPNIVEMTDFFEDDVNYYIEMVPHGLPGMDLFDYIEMRSTMEEAECRNIFLQVVDALDHLHTKALVVHRDIKDENIVLDGEGRVKLIDFGSAAYLKNGPFDVFVGTIDYAAPEVLQGKSYRGKEQDIWALGILLYTLVYKENPFYSIDEILDHELRIPWVMSEHSIDLIKAMLNRDVDQRLTTTQVKEHAWCRGEVDV